MENREYLEALTIESLSRKADLGNKSFEEVAPLLLEIRDLLIEGIKFLTFESVKEGFKISLKAKIDEFKAFSDGIYSYDLDVDAARSFQDRTAKITNIKNYHTNIFNFKNNLISILVSIKSFAVKSVDLDAIEASKIFQEKKKEFDRLIIDLRKKSGEETAADFASIFEEQSIKHSCFELKVPNLSKGEYSPIRIGASQLWLIIGLGLIGTLIWYIGYHIEDTKDLGYDIYEMIKYISKKAITYSLLFFGIRFSFRQFSINKHLYSLNKHRSNSLNSFTLFSNSIDKNDSQYRNALILEIAKSIFDSGQTGYLPDKNIEVSSPSIVELTRMVAQKNEGK
ncbi:hypothetical protein A0128_20360 [Leptospira tipperaryensis]|uniref:Uncharacterized protein n=1 Tax=Leptospira tipperaryensis TaxID=2564040 RepID=A0A1D7V3H6_9LEPT|nr:hypothetical protein [Leptospira tipperaryensis]AOP36373.1 hypothetical protein A0128_20360 [Leptospira tipperaryensis]